MTRSTKTATPSTAPAGPQLLTLAVETLAEHPRNVRRDVGDVTELADSLVEVGLLEPLVVAPDPDDPDAYVVIAGHRRLAAARLAMLPDLPCLVRHDLTTDTDVVMAMLVENLQRTDLTPVEEAEAYQQLELAGIDQATIAKRTGRSKRTVASRLDLMRLPETTREGIHHHQVTLEEAAAMLEFADDPAAVEALQNFAGTNDFKWRLQSLRQDRQRAEKAAARRAELEAAGVRLVKRSDLGGESYLFQLSYALHRNYTTLTDEQAADHASCPGHAHLDPSDNVLAWLCLQPELHGAPRPSTGDDQDDDEDLNEEQATAAAERMAAAKAEDDARAAAATVRLDHLRTVTTAKTPMPPDQLEALAGYLAQVVLNAYLETNEISGWLWLLDPSLDRDDIDADAAPDLLADLAKTRPGSRVLLAGVIAEDEATLVHSWRWQPTHLLEALPYFDLVQALGHQWSTWEADRIAAARQEAADRAAAATERAASEPAEG
jgi:ParB family transcriptional regulator, chromosome partitioning protein